MQYHYMEIESFTIPPARAENGRKTELGSASVLFCFLVMLIHAAAEGILHLQTDSLSFGILLGVSRLSSFVVQGFLFLSGVKLFLPRKKPFRYGAFYLGRLRRVGIPYLVSCIFYIAYMFFTETGRNFSALPQLCLRILDGSLCGHFYFVIVICQFYLLMPVWRYLVRQGNRTLSLLVSMVLMIFVKIYLPYYVQLVSGVSFEKTANVFAAYLVYFVAGCFCGACYERFRVFLRTHRRILLVGWAVTGAITYGGLYLQMRGGVYMQGLDLWHILYCVFAIPGALSLLYGMREYAGLHAPLFRMLERLSYPVYLLHPLVGLCLDRGMTAMGWQSLCLRFVVRVCVLWGGTIGAAWIAVLLERARDARREKSGKPML